MHLHRRQVYRGGHASTEVNHLGEVRCRRADLLELFLELLRPLEIGSRELSPELALAQAQEQLPGRALVDPAGGRAGVELCQERDELPVRRLALLEQVGARPPVQL
jgi:hypothetical protein